MRKFSIKVNDEVFAVEVEEIGSDTRSPGAPMDRVSPPVAAVSVAPPAQNQPGRVAAPATRAPAGSGQKVEAPLPGLILDIKVSTGQKVEAGQVMFILEAMKMENEIPAPAAGTVAEILVDKGATVAAGDALATIG